MERPYLEINTAAGTKQLVLGKEPVSIGRHSDNRVVVTDNMASRFHCVIEKVPDGYLLRDLGASNGTFVNGRQVKTAILMPGDVVRVGKVDLVLVIPGAEGHAEPEPIGLDQLEEVVEDLSALEPLSEGDVVDGDFGLVPSGPRAMNVEDMDPEDSLRRLAEASSKKPFGESDIELINPRGQTVHAAGQRAAAGSSRQVVDLFRLLLLVCFRGRVSDVHIEPKEDSYQVRLRIDGVMVDAAKLSTPLGTRVNALVKVISEIDPSQRTTIQEGHFTAKVPGPSALPGGRRVDYRVSFAPSVYGQKLVIRVLDASNAPAKVGDLTLPEWMETDVSRAIRQDSGMVLVCGPTGSGKTTTLYALLRSIDLRQRNVVTIEDPVEIQIEGVTQLPVDEEKGKSFSGLLRSVLRQDPDVILVGEIRDAETARIAMQAAITGHLVFSTVHTKDTLGTVFRLLDLGVEPYMLGQGLQVVLAQRLVRQLCPVCKVPQPITEDQKAVMGPLAEGVTTLYTPGGCYQCMGTGYAGRRGVFELLGTSDKLRDAIARSASPMEMQDVLKESNYQTLKYSGYQLAAQGAVAYEEIESTVGR